MAQNTFAPRRRCPGPEESGFLGGVGSGGVGWGGGGVGSLSSELSKMPFQVGLAILKMPHIRRSEAHMCTACPIDFTVPGLGHGFVCLTRKKGGLFFGIWVGPCKTGLTIFLTKGPGLEVFDLFIEQIFYCVCRKILIY